MKFFTPILAIAVLAACGETVETAAPEAVKPPLETVEVEMTAETQAEIEKTFNRTIDVPEFYAEGWEVTPGWPGEYPPGFSILNAGVTVMGREDMDPTLEPVLTCLLPKFATYQVWNVDRALKDDIIFAVATKMFDITMTQDTSIDVPGESLEDPYQKLDLKVGDTLVYKRYLGEGFAILARDGKDYEINEMDLQHTSDINTASQDGRGAEDLWVRATCADPARTRAWLQYKDVINIKGIGPTPIMGYAESRDITAEDIPEITRQMEYDDAVETQMETDD